MINRVMRGPTVVRQNRTFWCAAAMLVALAVFLSTLQTNVNGSEHPYATDVGEMQNALPRWGLIHRSGYPLYTATGSLFVTALRLLGIQPAAGASLFSTLWGVVTVGLLVVLAYDLGASGPAAALGALTAAFRLPYGLTPHWLNCTRSRWCSLSAPSSLRCASVALASDATYCGWLFSSLKA